MIEVEDKDPRFPMNVTVGISSVLDNLELRQGSVEVLIHKDTWPALKEAIEATFGRMDAKTLTAEQAAKFAEILERGYV